jgi:D-alanine-D-alanine ligase
MLVKRFSKVAVLKGGPSSEREVSLKSGAAVARALREREYDVAEIDVTGREIVLPAGIEAVFIALHGEFGEDGEVQSILRGLGVPYTGSGPAASRTALDKCAAKRVFEQAGILTPEYEVLRSGQARRLALPVVVKPPRQGSTIGIHRVFQESEWAEAMADALRYGDEVLVERFIAGRELTVGILGEEALPIIEIRAPDGWYDYGAKYTKGKTEYLTKAPIAADKAAECSRIAERAFRALGCSAMGRVDFLMEPSGRLFVLEVNTIPGFTETSLLPKAARERGIEFAELCDRILSMASLR